MRNLDKLVLLGGGALLALALLLEISSVTRLNATVSRAFDEAGALVERANKNNLPPRSQNPKEFTGRVFAAWETPPINAHPFGAADFYPNNPAPAGEPATPAPPPRPVRGRR